MSLRLAVTGSNLCGDAPFSVALAQADGVHCVSSPAGERGDLAGLCRDLFARQGVQADQVDEILIDVGPGSYTGLRVAVTFVRFLQAFGEVPVRCVDSLALLVRHALAGREQELDGRSVRALLDARRGRLHTASFEWRDGALHRREESQAALVDELVGRLGASEVVVAPEAMLASIGDVLREREIDSIEARGLTAAALFGDGLPFQHAEAADLEPRYLMQSYAEQ